MKILVVSDTHGRNENLYEVIRKEKPFDYFIHCGDGEGVEDQIEGLIECPKCMVRGNCDYCSPLPAVDCIDVYGRKLIVTHGHMYAVNSGLDRLVSLGRDNGADIVLYGHSHIPDYSYHYGVHLFNPGSLSAPRQEGRKCTYGIITIDKEGKINCSLQAL